jgi:hypothetical protein
MCISFGSQYHRGGVKMRIRILVLFDAFLSQFSSFSLHIRSFIIMK